ncbi:MAG TPA: hypothetical protein VIP46_22660 [Pyrinomonadaceae bacterium]
MADEKQKVRLKDVATSFYDDETGFTITRDEVGEVGPGAGKKTLKMMRSGGLLKVDATAAKAATGASAPSSQQQPQQPSSQQQPQQPADVLPNTFPGVKQLTAAGIKSRAQLAGMTPEARAAVKGITPEVAAEIEKAIAAK